MGAVALSAFKDALPGYTGTADDAQLAVELAAAEAQVAAVCGWPRADDGSQSFETSTYTLYPRPSLSRPRMLPLPVVAASVTSVHVTSSDTYDAGSLVDSADYTLTDDGIWSLSGSWARVERGNRAIVVAGWDEGSAPAAVQAAVIAQALHRWRILRTAQGIPQSTQRGTSIARDSERAVPTVVATMARLSAAWRWAVAIG